AVSMTLRLVYVPFIGHASGPFQVISGTSAPTLDDKLGTRAGFADPITRLTPPPLPTRPVAPIRSGARPPATLPRHPLPVDLELLSLKWSDTRSRSTGVERSRGASRSGGVMLRSGGAIQRPGR